MRNPFSRRADDPAGGDDRAARIRAREAARAARRERGADDDRPTTRTPVVGGGRERDDDRPTARTPAVRAVRAEHERAEHERAEDERAEDERPTTTSTPTVSPGDAEDDRPTTRTPVVRARRTPKPVGLDKEDGVGFDKLGRGADGTRSAELYARAKTLLPGGVNSPVRAMRAIDRDPIFIERGEGAELVDVDGNRYVDYVCSWGPLIHGHAHPEIVKAVQRAAARGTSYGAPTAGEVDLAAEIVDRMPSVEMVRMTSSGTEAAMSAIRLARAVTGKDLVMKFAGAYHGHVDGLLAEAGSGLLTSTIPASPGVPDVYARQTLIVPWNDPQRFLHIARRNGSRTAAIIVEPIPANMGLVPPVHGWLNLLRKEADRSGALLIFDEVITGFRVARGGAQELEGVEPDLTVMGKVVGGGLPAAAFGGRAEHMDQIAPAGDVYQAGTLSGNPLAVAAGLASLDLLDAGAYGRLHATTDRLVEGLRDAAGDRPVQVVSAPGLLTVFFSAEPVYGFEGASSCDLEAYARFCRAMLERGIYTPASQFEAWFPSLAHTDAHVERTISAAAAAFDAAFERRD